MNIDQEIKWKNEYEEFRNTLPGYARSGFSRFQGEMVYLHARQQSEYEIKVLRMALQSHGEIIEMNYKLSQEIGKLRKMIVALDNGIPITCNGLTYFKGEFTNECGNER